MMPKEAPFDVWDGEELGLTDEVEDAAAEETAMHVDPESEIERESGVHWSELTDGEEVADPEAPVCCYFADEQHDPARAAAGNGASDDEHELDLEELLERQHYSFPTSS
jgi:hypothetical protein